MSTLDSAGYYTRAVLEQIAREQGCEADELEDRFVITMNGVAWILVIGGYTPAIARSDLSRAMLRELAPVPPPSATFPAGISWLNGDRRRSLEDLLEQYSSPAYHVVYTFIGVSRFDPITKTFYQRVARPRILEPLYSEAIAKWLEDFGGAQHGKLLDWIATAGRLDRPTAALMLLGPKGLGKTLLALGLSRIYGTDGPADADALVAKFNDDLLETPVVLADEGLPRALTSAFTRSFLARTIHTIRLRFVRSAKLRGCPRLIITANNRGTLGFESEEFSTDDVDAIADRILVIDAQPAAGEFLRSIGGFEATTKWVEEDLLARHFLWLQANREVAVGARFLVAGVPDRAHRQLALGGTRGRVLEWVTKMLLRPNLIATAPPVGTNTQAADKKKPADKILVGDGRILVNTTFVNENWTKIFSGPNERVPASKILGPALRALARKDRPEERVAGVDYYSIDVTHILDVVEDWQVATREDIERLVANGPAVTPSTTTTTTTNTNTNTSATPNSRDNVIASIAAATVPPLPAAATGGGQ